MILTYDNYRKLKQSKVFLANPQKNYIGILSGVKELELTINFNTLSEVSFKVYKYENGIENPLYNNLESKRLLEVQYISWFVIKTCNENNNGINPYKTIKGLTLENELIGKRIYNIDGVFALYNIADTEHSLLHVITAETNWGIGHIDPELMSLYRTFSIDSSQIYNLLVTDISKSFDCIFQFDTYSKTINAYKLDNIGNLTDIFITHKNILKEYTRQDDADKIITKLRVLGADDVDIRAVNPTGMNYIINVDYYKIPISQGGWMTDGLVQALDNYQTIYDSKVSLFSSNMSTLQTLQAELNTLNASLVDLQSNKTAQESIIGVYVQNYNGTPPIGSPEYTLYLNAVNLRDTYVAQINIKKSQISAKEIQITSTQSYLDSISNDLDLSLYFTQLQLDELDSFLTENDEYQDSTFVQTDSMTDQEVISMKMELLVNGKTELDRVSKPQYSLDITAKNLYTIQDEDRPISYDKWKENLSVGNLITIQFRPGLWKTVRLLSINFSFDNLEEINLTLSDKNRLDGDMIDELIAGAGRTTSTLSLNKYGYDEASNITSEVRTFMTGTFDASLNAIQSNANQDMYFDTYGLHMRKFLPDQNKYDNHQSWWTNNILLFTDDAWKTAKTGIGQFTTPTGDKIQAVFADVICGQLLMGENLAIANASGTYTINNNGFTATSTLNGNTYTVGMNPNTPSTIFRIAVNGSNKLYIDTVNSRLNIEGYINATGGTLGNLTVIGTITGGIFTGSNFNGGTFNGGTINGATIISTGTLGGTTLTTTISNGYITSDGIIRVNTSGYICEISANSIILRNSSNTALASYGEGAYVSGSLTVIGDALLTNTVCSTLKVNNSDVITVANRSSYTFNPSSHMHSSNDIYADVQDSAYIQFYGGRAAGYNWCLSTFELKSPSDLRLKKNVRPLDELPIELFMELKPYMYELKCKGYGDGIRFGFFSQMVESAFMKFGLNAIDYNLIEIIDSSQRTDEGEYVLDGKIHRLCYENFHAWDIHVTQFLYSVYSDLNNRVLHIENILTSK